MLSKMLMLVAAAGGMAGAWAEALPELKIDPAQVSVSGISSGGFMAVQLHVAYSATFKKGAGVAAAGPYYCAEGSLVYATGRCTAHNSSIPVDALVKTTKSWATSGAIDPVSNLQSSRLYLFSGTIDSVVAPAVVNDLQSYYSNFVPTNQTVYKKDLAAEHAFVTDDFGSSCSVKEAPYINDCNFDLAGALLQQIYGTLSPRRAGALSGRWVEFDQRAFVGGHALAEKGWAFVPQACGSGSSCKLHVVLHGCKQSTADAGQQYVQSTGYSRWADTNNIVLLYPQTGVTATNGCWDWWGYDSADYAKKSGPQMKAVKAMVDHVAGGALGAALAAPAGLAASQATDASVKLSWKAVTGATGYVLYRNGGRVATLGTGSLSYTDTDLVAGSSYAWSVRALGSNSTHGALSSALTARTTGTLPQCTLTNNYNHTVAGRAYASWGWTFATGSNEPMGLWNIYIDTVLKNTGTAYYYRIGTCY